MKSKCCNAPVKVIGETTKYYGCIKCKRACDIAETIKVDIKPLSVNKAWQGRRYKTDDYKSFEEEMLYKLPPLDIPKGIKLELYVEFGFSNSLSDIDNPLKMTLDCLQKKYGFNDRKIYELHVKKVIVKKGDDYIKFNIKEI